MKDTGIGMNKEQRDNLFFEYKRSSSGENQLGSGLGLCICKAIVSKLGGEI